MGAAPPLSEGNGGKAILAFFHRLVSVHAVGDRDEPELACLTSAPIGQMY